MEWTDPAVQAAIVESVGNVLATTIAAISAALIGQQFINRKKLQESLAEAQADIRFLLAVEEEHCEMHRETDQQSFKNTVRNIAYNRGLMWSGRHTPGRVKTQ